jgi:4-amino-4-deoxy-L-arabinose transferase-like glycosyltransferase
MKNYFSKYKKYHILVLCIAILYGALWLETIHLATLQKNEHMAIMVPVVDSDSAEYKALSQNLFINHVFKLDPKSDYETFRTPGYPLFIGIINKIFNTYFAVTLMQIVLTFLTALLLFKITLRFFSRKSALVSPILFLMSPTAITQSLVLLSDTLFVFLLILILYILFSRKATRRMYIVAGLLLGISVLVRPISLFLPILIIPFLFIFNGKKEGIKKVMVHSGLFLAALALMVMPWMARNNAVAGHFAISSLSAYNLFHYNLPEYIATKQGISAEAARETFETKLSPQARENQKSLRYSNDLSAISVPFLKSHLISYAFFHGIKTVPFFITSSIESAVTLRNSFLPNDTNISVIQENLSDLVIHGKFAELATVLVKNPFITLEQIFWVVVMALSLYAVLRNYKKPQYWLFLLIIFYFAFLTGPVSYSRYRLPAEPFMLTLGVIGAGLIIRDIHRRFRPMRQTHETH